MRPLAFPIRAHFDFFAVLFFAVDRERVRKLLPTVLNLDLFEDHALFAVAVVQTKKFRPAFLPAFLGQKFNLVGYRFLTTYQRNDGKTIRGLKIIRSQTNQKIMKWGGDRLSQYKFEYNPIVFEITGNAAKFSGNGIEIGLKLHDDKAAVPLPETSIFPTWQHARKYAGPLLYTFELDASKKQISITEGTRKNWTPKPVEVTHYQLDFLKDPMIAALNPVLSSAFIVRDIPYDWKKAVIENYSE